MVIRSAKELAARYHDIRAGDVFIGLASPRYLKHGILIDLQTRGIRCLPSPLSQVLNSSKVFQAFIFKDYMLPLTRIIHRRLDLLHVINEYNKHRVGPVVSKQDHIHCGQGIRRWEGIESLYSHMALSEASYPFVLQPYIENFSDVRVIIVGDHVEAYGRQNPDNFRVNLSSGGMGRPLVLDADREQFCRSAMKRGAFPFAHLDLLMLSDGRCYLSEIALNGGTKGAGIDRRQLDEKKMNLLENMAKAMDVDIADKPEKGGDCIDSRR